MKTKLIKRILKYLLFLVLSFVFIMLLPRLWAVIFPEKPPVGYHYQTLDILAIISGLEHLINKYPETPPNIAEFKNIEYKNIDGKSLQLDIYKAKNLTKPAPLLVFIHGGGWKSGQREDYKSYLNSFAMKGYITATVSYRLLPDSVYPACVEDIADAVQWLFTHGENYGYDPDRIALIGGSAGAHLALLTAYGWNKTGLKANFPDNKHKIKAVVDIYGPTDLTTEYARTQSVVTNFLGHTYSENPKVFKEASPIFYLDKNDPPTLILQGTSDQIVPYSQSDLLKTKLDSLGIPAVYYKLPLWPHTMDVVQRVNDYCQLKLEDFVHKYVD
jgi:acetyl esterase/lipase